MIQSTLRTSAIVPALSQVLDVSDGGMGNALWDIAGARPSLDLDFATTKSLVDRISGQNLVTFGRAGGTATYVDATGTIVTAAADEPPFTHDPVTLRCLGLRVEELRTNLLLRSEEFDNASWNPVPSTVTANTQTAPNGTLTADTVTTALGTGALFQTVACVASTVYTFSFYVKLGTMAASDFRFAVRDDSNGAFIATDIAPNVTPVTTEWRRVTYTFTTPVGCVLVRPYPYRAIPATYGTTAFIWGAQLEAGAFPTSYIPTTGAQATRNADVATIAGPAFSSWYRQDEGTLLIQWAMAAFPNTGGARVFELNSPSGTDIIWGRTQGGTNRVYDVTAGGVSQASLVPGAYTAGQSYRSAIAYKANDFAFSENGGIATDVAGSVPLSIDRLGIGCGTGGGNQGNLTIFRLTYFPQRLPNAKLQAITA